MTTNNQLSARIARGQILTCHDAITLLESGFHHAAIQTVRQFDLSYTNLVIASESIGNREIVAKAQALYLLGLSGVDSLRIASLLAAQQGAYAPL